MRPLFFLALLVILSGCAGGGATTSPTPPPSSTYEPNYFSSLGAGRQWGSFSLHFRLYPASGARLATHFATARTAWEPYDAKLFTLTETAGTAEIEVETVLAGSLGGDTVGSTTVTFQRSSGKIIKAQIQVDVGLGDDLLPQVLSHELGHALGLDGHSPDPADLMYPRAHLPLAITERDRNTFFTIYADQLALRGRAQSLTALPDSALVRTVVCRYRRP